MTRRWSIPALCALALCANTALAQKAGNVELSLLAQYGKLEPDIDIDHAFGLGGAFAVFLSNRVKVTASSAYHPTQFRATGEDVAFIPVRFGLAYEQPLASSVRAVLGAHASLIASPKEEWDDVGGGGSFGLKFGRKVAFLAQVTGDFLPPWLNPRTFTTPPATEYIHKTDGYITVGAGLSLRLGSDGRAPAPVVATQPPPTTNPVTPPVQTQPTPPPVQPQPQPQPVTPVPQPQPERTVELEPIYFDFDQATLRPDAVAALDRITAILRANPNSVILIEGHTDERGTDAYNERLGQRRAAAALSYLTNQGLPATRLQTVSRGERQPADDARSESAYAHNRRVEFRLQSGGPLRPAGN